MQVVELVPPAVRTELMPGPSTPHAMPLDEYLTETIHLLETQPDAEEILVERVRSLRFFEVRGNRADLMRALAGTH